MEHLWPVPAGRGAGEGIPQECGEGAGALSYLYKYLHLVDRREFEMKKESIDSWIGWKIIDACAKIAIPISVALLAFFQMYIYNKNEIETKKLIFNNQQSYQNMQTDLKLVEILWPLLVSSDSMKIMSSMKLAQKLRPELSAKIMASIWEDRRQPSYVRKEASKYLANLNDKLLLGYKFNIYYINNSIDAKRMAKVFEKIILDRKINNQVYLYQKDESFFDYKYNYIYFTERDENIQAQTLLALIESLYPEIYIKLEPVQASIKNTLSIYLFQVTPSKGRISTDFSPASKAVSE
jgi:hypothetical protein